jgi:hypothetical protein
MRPLRSRGHTCDPAAGKRVPNEGADRQHGDAADHACRRLEQRQPQADAGNRDAGYQDRTTAGRSDSAPAADEATIREEPFLLKFGYYGVPGLDAIRGRKGVTRTAEILE